MPATPPLDESLFAGARLCVVGNINRDIKTSPIPAGDHLLRDGETPLLRLEETIGGGGANSAAIAARLGARVDFIGQIGADRLGDNLGRALEGYGVRCHLHRAAHLTTGSTINLVFDNGQRHFLSSHPNNEGLEFEPLDLRSLAGASHLLRADLWFSEAMLFGGNEKLFAAARRAGVPVSVDLNWDPQWGRATTRQIVWRKESVRALLPHVALAHGNVRELCEFTDTKDLHAALRRLEGWGVGAVVVHMGAQGAGYFSKGELVVEPPAPVTRALRVTGTGDVLSACMILMHHLPDVSTRDKLRFANRIVAQFIEGLRELIPDVRTVD